MDNTFKRIIRYFFSGTLFIVPLVATGYFIYVSFRWLDDLLNLPYPGLGFAIILFAITAFGYLTTNFAFRTFTGWFDRGMNKIPLVKLIYAALKDLLNAFVGEKKKFNKPVLVEINRENKLYQIGFITQADLTRTWLKRYGFSLLATFICVLRAALCFTKRSNYAAQCFRHRGDEIYCVRRSERISEKVISD